MAQDSTLTRRALGCAAIFGVAGPLLVACGSEDSGAPAAGGDQSPAEEATSGTALVAVADVPVGGGVILSERELVVTQPTEGEFKAFTAVCTHQGCLVNSVEGDEVVCPCHGSRFGVADGEVTAGPAPAPLTEVEIQVSDGQVVLA